MNTENQLVTASQVIDQGTELFDLGDATKETRQLAPSPTFVDNIYGWGLLPNMG